MAAAGGDGAGAGDGVPGAGCQTSRDNARTPMQRSAALQGGFTTGRPWSAVNPNDGSGLPDLMITSLPMNNRHLSPPRPMLNAHSGPKSCKKCRLYSCTSGVLGTEINGIGAIFPAEIKGNSIRKRAASIAIELSLHSPPCSQIISFGTRTIQQGTRAFPV